MHGLHAALLTVLLSVGTVQAGTINVAQGKGVSAIGSYTGTLSTIVDGTYLAENTYWQTSTVWWAGTDTRLTIDLGGSYTIDGAAAQADNNDTYLLEYWDGAQWLTAWNIPAKPNGGGMATRPDQSSQQALTPFTTNQLRFSATGGDNYYSVSEVKAFAQDVSVPEPATMLLVGCALIWIARTRRK